MKTIPFFANLLAWAEAGSSLQRATAVTPADIALAATGAAAHVAQLTALIAPNVTTTVSGSTTTVGEYLTSKMLSSTALYNIRANVGLISDASSTETVFDRDAGLVFVTTGEPIPRNNHSNRDATTVRTGPNVDGGMWQRDSSAQMHYYVIAARELLRGKAHAAEGVALVRVVASLLRNHAKLILLDSWANAFHAAPKLERSADRHMRRGGYVQTGNYEPDGLASIIILAHDLWQTVATVNPAVVGPEAHAALGAIVADLFDWTFKLALEKVVIQVRQEQAHALSSYFYIQSDGEFGANGTLPGCVRFTDDSARAFDDKICGHGTKVDAGNGMTWGGFRPSDDVYAYGYNVPVNMLLSIAMRRACVLANDTALFGGGADPELAAVAATIADEIDAGIMNAAVVEIDGGGTGGTTQIFAYEVDALGNVNLMDDANLPNLLAAPWLGGGWEIVTKEGICTSCPIMAATRRWVKTQSKYWHSGACGEGLGSPHTSMEGNGIWHLGLLSQLATARTNATELADVLHLLAATDCNTGLLHEAFDASNSCQFTRPTFGWPNSLFAEIVTELAAEGRLTKEVLGRKRIVCKE